MIVVTSPIDLEWSKEDFNTIISLSHTSRAKERRVTPERPASVPYMIYMRSSVRNILFSDVLFTMPSKADYHCL